MLSIATWNVNSLKARAEHVQRFLDGHSPDVLMVQEVKSAQLLAQFDGYEAASKLQKAYSGVAIFSRKPFKVIKDCLDGDQGQARYLEIELETGQRLINIYAPNGNPADEDVLTSEKFAYKMAWHARLQDRIETLRDARIPFLVGGDFNIIPDAIDCYDEERWEGDALFCPPTRDAWRRMINAGMIDAFRALDQNSMQYTFWDYRGNVFASNRGIRIDHFLLSPTLADNLQSCKIDKSPRGWEKPSDHTPVILEIKT